MAGVGKTTLMKRIHNELGKREHSFDLVLWAVVSKDCDINRLNTIMTDISRRLGIDGTLWKESSRDQRVAKIYVLMLDDLWGKLELQAIGTIHDRLKSMESKVENKNRNTDFLMQTAKLVSTISNCYSTLYQKLLQHFFSNQNPQWAKPQQLLRKLKRNMSFNYENIINKKRSEVIIRYSHRIVYHYQSSEANRKSSLTHSIVVDMVSASK
ncbi:NB-ARC domain disease resistance protein [Medicago truncatula]|uniref:NB-ARC domain disease resistance protein n=1 Tax=Medicago truncatula TaxID=3880 RepID=G7KL95_MEDTR|nr:NB-ARC domain disease resistance protein [Medicago truncatula]